MMFAYGQTKYTSGTAARRQVYRRLAHALVVAAASGAGRFNQGTGTMMHDMGSMMWGMGLVWLIVIIVLVLAVAALVKYVFFR